MGFSVQKWICQRFAVALGTLLSSFYLVKADPLDSWNKLSGLPITSWTVLKGVAWNGTNFVVVGYSPILCSPDGTNWIQASVTSASSYSFFDVVWNGSVFVAVGDGRTASSRDGRTWTKQDIPGAYLNSVTWNGSKFVAVGNSGTILTSLEGSVWTNQTSGTTKNLKGVAWSGKEFLAVGGDTLVSSANGQTWFSQQVPDRSFLDVAGGNNQFVAIGSEKVESGWGGRAWASSDWVGQPSFGYAACVVWTGGQFIIFSGGKVLASTDGKNWAEKCIRLRNRV